MIRSFLKKWQQNRNIKQGDYVIEFPNEEANKLKKDAEPVDAKPYDSLA